MDQWLYGDEKDESKEDGEINDKGDEGEKSPATENGVEKETPMEEGEKEDDAGLEVEKDGEGDQKENDKEDGDKEDGEKGEEDSSDEDDVTITIGVLKTQPDIIQAPSAPHGARFQPKAAPTTGLKDEDFTSPGKVNGVPVGDFSYNDMEDKPWRKPGADISDYFNYGFNEETWFKYCERQKRMRVTESGAGLSGLGVSITKPFGNAGSTNIPVAIVNDNSKYGGTSSRPRAGPPPRPINKPGQNDVNSSKPSTIQVMTADRREYSNKVMNGPPPVQTSFMPGYNDMEFGGNPYGDTYYPPPEAQPYYGGPPPFPPIHWGSSDAPISNQSSWEGGGGGGGHNVTPVSSSSNYFDESSNMSAPPPIQEQEEERHSRSRRSHRSRSRSPTRHKHSSSRHRSRSRSPSHRHKRKKSKRERDAD